MRGRLSWIGAIPHVVITVLMVVVTVDMLVGVFLRYVMTWVSATFDLPTIRFFWVEEVGEWSLAWMSFIGAALGVRRGVHFAVHLVIDRFPVRLRRAVLAAQCLLIVAFDALIAVFGWQVAELNSQSFSPALVLNLRWLYLSSVVGGALMAVSSRSGSIPSTSPPCSPPPSASASSCRRSASVCSWPCASPTSRSDATSGRTGPTWSRCSSVS